ncbi:MAG: lipoprotein-releasing ABC transporter permease subunit [Magnetospirillum sp. WYHS-4]
MFSRFEWMMAMRYLRARRQEGFISVIAWFSLLGIGLGVATLIIVMSVMNGFRQELLTRILGVNGHLSVTGPSNQLLLFDMAADQVRKIPGVVQVTPLIEGQVMVTAKGVARGAMIRGVRPDDLAKRKMIADNIVGGDLTKFGGPDHVVVGGRLAGKLGLDVGDDITVISPKGSVTAFGTVPRLRTYKIAATFRVGMFEYDSNFVFLPLEAAQTFFQMPEKVSNLEIFVEDPHKARQLTGRITAALGGETQVYDWQQANSSFFNAIQVERNVMFLILTLIILVAAFNIISSLIMLVKDKHRDIAILRTMGATRGMILRVFFIAGASVGVIGTTFGVALGLSFTRNIESVRQFIQGFTGNDLFAAEIYFLSKLPAIVDYNEVIAVVGMGLGLSLLATLYPSWRAARIDPAEALRYE